MQRTLLLPLTAIFLAMAAGPSLADDRGDQDQILKGGSPSERDYLSAPHHFNDSVRLAPQVSAIPTEEQPAVRLSKPRFLKGTLSISTPDERYLSRATRPDGLSVD